MAAAPDVHKRRQMCDVRMLLSSNHEVKCISDMEYIVKLHGPKDTPYENGVWCVRVTLLRQYPFKPPKLQFMNKIFHPNIDELSGVICLDMLDQTWTPLYSLTVIFETVLPQLLTYPNATDPLNRDAALLLLTKESDFNKRTAEYVQRYASVDDCAAIWDAAGVGSSAANRS